MARRAVPNHPATLADLGRLWTGYGQKGRDATSVLTQWLEGLKNENTKRSYRTAVLEFWQWSSNDRSGVVPLPDRVTEAEAARFVDYLATRRYGMEQYRLDRDRERQLDARIYRYVKDHPGARFEEIRIDAGVARDAAGDLDQHLGRLVQERLLTRQPTLAELRRTPDGARAQLDGRVDPGLFTYRVPKRADARQSTLATRVAGLASLWSALGLPNPWTTWATTLKPKVAAERSSRRQAPMDEALLEKLLQTTVRPDGRASPQDLRDRAAILLLASCGLHVNELGRIRQSDWTGAELVITNADGEIRTVQLPNVLQQILTAFLERLQSIEDRRVRQGRPPIHSVAPDAPLLPVLKRWGKTTQFPASSERGITRSGLAMVLRQRAQRAGLEPGSEEFRKVHPSALRTLRGKLGTTVSQAAT